MSGVHTYVGVHLPISIFVFANYCKTTWLHVNSEKCGCASKSHSRLNTPSRQAPAHVECSRCSWHSSLRHLKCPHCLARARLTADKDERLQNARANRQSGQKQNVIVVTFSVTSVVSQGRPHRHRGACSGHTLVSTFDKTENFKTGTRPASTRTTICFETSASSARLCA